MKRGCLTISASFGATILAWLAMLLYFLADERRGPGDSGGSAMGAGMFLISWGAAIALAAGAVVALLVWANTRPPEP